MTVLSGGESIIKDANEISDAYSSLQGDYGISAIFGVFTGSDNLITRSIRIFRQDAFNEENSRTTKANVGHDLSTVLGKLYETLGNWNRTTFGILADGFEKYGRLHEFVSQEMNKFTFKTRQGNLNRLSIIL